MAGKLPLEAQGITAQRLREASAMVFSHAGLTSWGRCPVCGWFTTYAMTGHSVRESYRCLRCLSSARNRMVGLLLSEELGLRHLAQARRKRLAFDVYVASATGPVVNALGQGRPRVFTSELREGYKRGGLLPDGRSTCQDLESLTFGDSQFDLVVTEDVLEHVRDVDRALQEIRRVLRPGGRHIFTVPFLYDRPTLTRVDTSGPHDVPLMPDEWHGDSIRGRILSYRTFGYDLFDLLRGNGFAPRMITPSLKMRRAGVYDSVAFVCQRS